MNDHFTRLINDAECATAKGDYRAAIQAFSAAQDATDCRFQIAGVQNRIEALKPRLPFRWPSRKKEEK